MYAVIKSGGRQYRVEQGSTIRVDRLAGEKGQTVELDQVLLVADGENVTAGAPTVAGARVTAEILGEVLGPKLLVFKFRRRKAYRKKTGHRQPFTALKITGITA
jgi:large subunit ribosomal protein L21